MKILQFAKLYWKFLLGVALVSAALAAFFSGPDFIEPKYTSSTVIYPANLGAYSGEARLDQMQQYLESNAIRDSIIQKFNLYDEYDIDRKGKTARTIMNEAYEDHITFDETRYESISITVTSTDPEKAKRMADEVLHQLNLTIRKTEREKYKELLLIDKNLLDSKKTQLDSLEKRIQTLSVNYGILDYIAQAEEVTEGYMRFLLSGKKGEDFEEAKELYANLEKYGRSYHNLHAQLNEINEEYIKRLHSYEHSLKNYTKEQTYTYVLVAPEVPDKKSYPIRWAIVLAASLSSTGFALVLLLVLGFQKKKHV